MDEQKCDLLYEKLLQNNCSDSASQAQDKGFFC